MGAPRLSDQSDRVFILGVETSNEKTSHPGEIYRNIRRYYLQRDLRVANWWFEKRWWRDYPTMEGKMFNSSYVTVILHRRAMHFWIYWGYRGVA
jgi:hypothetical protein